ncbi:MAG: hypothetical protein E7452_08190 [Ruminococcaceae bacterium]|nr:hypothetical protein [Oscillospiraceae bacterium]
MNLTQMQQCAVFGRAKKLLVSAAAGSGKTMVLVERVFSRLVDPTDPADITEFLIVTFTNAAASEMRVRLLKRIGEALKLDPQNRHLRRQLTLVHEAQIATVHAFCLSLIRDQFHALDLRPDFRLPGENETELLLDEAAEQLLTEEHEMRSPAFDSLLAALSNEKNDLRLKDLLKRAHIWFESEADGEGYMEACRRTSAEAIDADPGKTPWGRQHLKTLAEKAAYFACAYDRMIGLARRADGKIDKVLEVLGEEQSLIAEIAAAAAANDWNRTAAAVAACCGHARTLRFPTKGFPADLAEAIKAAREDCKKNWKKKLENDVICEPVADIQAAFAEADALQQEFFRLVVRLGEIFAALKREANLLDFSDLEHLAIRLLAQKDSEGVFRPTALAEEKSRGFREIMVDEYQDTNGLQDLIFRMLATHSSLFTVGDVKQSIYRFRRADPNIFLRRKNRYAPAQTGGADAPFAFASAETSISLSDNFRSRREVLESVNLVFRALCCEELGEFEYTEDEALHCARSDSLVPPDPLVPAFASDDRFSAVDPAAFTRADFEKLLGEGGTGAAEFLASRAFSALPPATARAILARYYVTELDVLDLPGKSEDEDGEADEVLSGAEHEAAHIARRIRTLHDEGFLVADKNGQLRPCGYGDFAILLRSPKKRAAGLARALRDQGIPVAAAKNDSFFETDEITALIALLHVVDNPGSDLDLIGCMASPLIGFTYDELALIRAANRRKGLFYDSLIAAAADDTLLGQKAAGFLAWLAQTRAQIADLSASAAVAHLLETTAATVIYAALEGGENRRENILSLLALAQGYDKVGGFAEFVRYLDRLEESGNLSREAASEQVDCVKIMSIHASKGLEFPIVFLGGLSDPFNTRGNYSAVLQHPTLGLGFSNRSRFAGGEMTTLRKEAIAEMLLSEQLSEELRILYVAMTRAREKLICVASHKVADKALRPLEDGVPAMLPVYCRMHLSFAAWLEAVAVPEGQTAIRVNRVSVAYDTAHLPPAEAPIAVDPALCAQIAERLAYVYPHAAAAELPAKLTATLYKRLLAEDTALRAVAEVPRAKNRVRPRFTEMRRTLSPTERGTATHLAMQLLPMRAYESTEEISAALETLRRRGQISAEQAGAIEPGALLAFFQTPTGRTVSALPPERVRREFKFSLLVPAAKYFPESGEETIMLQGVADLFYETDDGKLVIVDFKTDNVTPATSALRAQGYAPQLAIYADALGEITGKPVAKKLLYFFATGELLEV